MADASLQDRTIVITGASDGIGRAAVRAYAAAGAHVIMVGRNEAKTSAAARAIMGETNSRRITWEIADLSRQDDLRDLAERLRTRCARIDVLVNNAGAVFLDRETTIDGIERTLALNHLAYMALTLLLLDRLQARPNGNEPTARVLCVSSRAHREAKLDLDDLQMARRYGGWRAYANSKLANILFTRALAARLDPTQVVVHALHPGVVSTRFAVNNGRRGRLMRRIMDLVSIAPDAGADTIVWLSRASEALATTGEYWVKRARVAPSRAGQDARLAESLWAQSAAMLGLDLPRRS